MYADINNPSQFDEGNMLLARIKGCLKTSLFAFPGWHGHGIIWYEEEFD